MVLRPCVANVYVRVRVANCMYVFLHVRKYVHAHNYVHYRLNNQTMDTCVCIDTRIHNILRIVILR